MNQENKNLFLAIILSIAIMLGFQYFYEAPRQAKIQQELDLQKSAEGDQIVLPGSDAPASLKEIGQSEEQVKDRADVISHNAGRVQIKSPTLNGSINLKGARLDDLTLVEYQVTTDPNSPDVELLSPSGTVEPYFVDAGWLLPHGFEGPDEHSIWSASGTVLEPGKEITLTWEARKSGLTFKKIFALDEKYMFTLKQQIVNHSGNAILVTPYRAISRKNPAKPLDFFILHEGPIGLFDGKLQEVKYKDLDAGKAQEFESKGGWLGFTDKYWMVTLIPDQADSVKTRFLNTSKGSKISYQIDYTGAARQLGPQATVEESGHIFAGAKKVKMLDAYETSLNIPKFDLAVDFGWFYFLTKPFFYALDFLGNFIGNFGVGILIFTIFIKAILFPLANKSYHAMSKMKKLQPEMQKIRENYGEDRVQLNQKMMELYKKEKVNPASGCLPIFVQIPVFFALYKVLFVTIEMRHAPFFGWIRDLSAPDPTTLFNLFGLIPWDPPSFLMIGIWPLIMGVTMYLQQKLNPAPIDPVQQKVFLALPFVFTYMLASFPAGLVIYWAWNNSLSILQQWLILRRAGVSIGS